MDMPGMNDYYFLLHPFLLPLPVLSRVLLMLPSIEMCCWPEQRWRWKLAWRNQDHRSNTRDGTRSAFTSYTVTLCLQTLYSHTACVACRICCFTISFNAHQYHVARVYIHVHVHVFVLYMYCRLGNLHKFCY